MAWTTPQVPVAGTVITVAWAAQTIVDNLNWFRAMTGQASPPGSGYCAESSSVGTTAWVPMVRRNGDQMANDLMVTRSLLGHAEQGYLFLGNSTSNFLGFDGVKHLFQTPGLTIDNDVTIYRRAASSTGYIFLGNTGGHYFGWDGSQHVINGLSVWFDGNVANRVTTSTIADLAVTTAKLADGSVTAPKVHSSVATVPSGLIAAFVSVGSIAPGWTRFTTANGKLLVGAGTFGGQTFVEGAGAGSSWAHLHGVSLTAAATASAAVPSGGASTASAAAHTHDVAGNTVDASWIPPSHTVVWAQKT